VFREEPRRKWVALRVISCLACGRRIKAGIGAIWSTMRLVHDNADVDPSRRGPNERVVVKRCEAVLGGRRGQERISALLSLRGSDILRAFKLRQAATKG
jgi:hypothetical protein